MPPSKGDKFLSITLSPDIDQGALAKLLGTFTDSFANALSNSLTKAIGTFTADLSKKIQTNFDATILNQFKKPITLKLDVEDAKNKITSLLDPLKSQLKALDKVTGLTGKPGKTDSKTVKSSLSQDDQVQLRENARTTLTGITSEFSKLSKKGIGGILLDELNDKKTEIAKVLGNIKLPRDLTKLPKDGTLFTEAQIAQLEDAITKLKEIEAEINRIKTIKSDRDTVLSRNIGRDLEESLAKAKRTASKTSLNTPLPIGIDKGSLKKGDVVQKPVLVTVDPKELANVKQSITLIEKLRDELSRLDDTKPEDLAKTEKLLQRIIGLENEVNTKIKSIAENRNNIVEDAGKRSQDKVLAESIKRSKTLSDFNRKLDKEEQDVNRGKTESGNSDKVFNNLRRSVTDSASVLKQFGLSEKETETFTKKLEGSIDSLILKYKKLEEELQKLEPDTKKVNGLLNDISNNKIDFRASTSAIKNNTGGILDNARNRSTKVTDDVKDTILESNTVLNQRTNLLRNQKQAIDNVTESLSKQGVSEKNAQSLTSGLNTEYKKLIGLYGELETELLSGSANAESLSKILEKLFKSEEKLASGRRNITKDVGGVVTDTINKQNAPPLATQVFSKADITKNIPGQTKIVSELEAELDKVRKQIASPLNKGGFDVPLVDITKKTSKFEQALIDARIQIKRLEDQLKNGEITQEQANTKFKAINETLARTKIAINQIDKEAIGRAFKSDEIDRFSKGLATNLAVLGFTLQRVGGQLQNFGQQSFQFFNQLATAAQPIEQTQNIIKKNFVETGKITREEAKKLVDDLKGLADLPGNNLLNITTEFNRLADALGNTQDAFDLTKGLSAQSSITGVDNTKEITEILLQARTKTNQFNNDNFGRIKGSGGSNTERAFLEAGITTPEIANQVGATKVIKILTAALKDLQPIELTTSDRFNALTNRVAELGKTIGLILSPALDNLNILLKEKILPILDALELKFKNLSPGTQELISNLALGIPVIALIVGGIISLGGALAFASSGFLQLKKLGNLAKSSLGLGELADDAAKLTTNLEKINPNLLARLANKKAGISNPVINSSITETSSVAKPIPNIIGKGAPNVGQLTDELSLLESRLSSLKNIKEIRINLDAPIGNISKDIIKTESSILRLTSRINEIPKAIILARETSFIGKGLTSLETFTNSIKTFFKTIISGFAELKNLPGAVVTAFKGIGGAIGEGFGGIVKFFTSFSTSIKEFGLLKGIFGGLIGTVTSVGSGIGGISTGLIKVLGLGTGVGIIINAILSIFTALFDNFNGIRDRFLSTFKNLDDSIRGILKLLGIDGGILKVLSLIGDAFNFIFGFVGEVLLDVVISLAGIVSDVLNNVIKLVGFIKDGDIISVFKELGKLIFNIFFGFIAKLGIELVATIGDALASIIEATGILGSRALANSIRLGTDSLRTLNGTDKASTQILKTQENQTKELEAQKLLIEKANALTLSQRETLKDISNITDKVSQDFASLSAKDALRRAGTIAEDTKFKLDKKLDDSIKAGDISPEQITRTVRQEISKERIASTLALNIKLEEIKRQAAEVRQSFVLPQLSVTTDQTQNDTNNKAFLLYISNLASILKRIQSGKIVLNDLINDSKTATQLQEQFSVSIDKSSEGSTKKYEDFISSYNNFQNILHSTIDLIDEQKSSQENLSREEQKRINERLDQLKKVREAVDAIELQTPLKRRLETINDEIERQQKIIEDFINLGDTTNAVKAQDRLNVLKNQQIELEKQILNIGRADKDAIKNAQDAQDESIKKDKTKLEIQRESLLLAEQIASKNSDLFQSGINGLSAYLEKIKELVNLPKAIINENLIRGLENITSDGKEVRINKIQDTRAIAEITNDEIKAKLKDKDLFTKGSPNEISPLLNSKILDINETLPDLIDQLKNGSSVFLGTAFSIGKKTAEAVIEVSNLVTESTDKIEKLKVDRNNAPNDKVREKITEDINKETKTKQNLLEIGASLSRREAIISKTIEQRIVILTRESNERKKILDIAVAILDNESNILNLRSENTQLAIDNANREAEFGNGIDTKLIQQAEIEILKNKILLIDIERDKQVKILEAKKAEIFANGILNGQTTAEIQLLTEQIDKQIELINIKAGIQTEGVKNEIDKKDPSLISDKTNTIIDANSKLEARLNGVGNAALQTGKNVVSLFNRLASGEGVINKFTELLGGTKLSVEFLSEAFTEIGVFAVTAFGQAFGKALTDVLINGGDFLSTLKKFLGETLIAIGGQLISLGAAAAALSLLALIPGFQAYSTGFVVGPLLIAAGVAAVLAGKALGGGGGAKQSNISATNNANTSAGNSGQVTYDPAKDPILIYQKALQTQVQIDITRDDGSIVKAVIKQVNRNPRFSNLVGNRDTGFAI